ncbi:MAG: exodeoxyribonuclease beta subunit, partial [Pseudomonadota bacterium]
MTPRPFQLDAPIPDGVFLVGASAGTGKTYSLVRLAARLLVEPTPGGAAPPTIEQLLIMTFTRDAATELLDRLRGFLSEAIAFLGAPPRDVLLSTVVDRGLAALASADGAWASASVLASRRSLLESARRDLDVGWITTIHGFCERILRNAPLEGGGTLDGAVLPDDLPLVDEAFSGAVHHALAGLDAGAVVAALDAFPVRRLRVQARAVLGAGRDVVLEPDLSGRGVDLNRWVREAGALGVRLAGPEGLAWVEALGALADAKGLHASRSPRAKLMEAYRHLCAGWQAGRFATPLGVLSRAKLSSNLNKGAALPSHAIAEAIADWEEAGASRAEDLSAWRCAILHDVRVRFRQALERARAHTFDDLIARVDAAMSDPTFVAGVRSRFVAALVDEFQDTDAVQWRMFRRLFAEGHDRRLGLIGDPKQSIYAFRGADVEVYDAASRAVPEQANTTLRVNHRSDAPLLRAVAHLFSGPRPFLHANIPFVDVEARTQGTRLLDGGGGPVAPFVVRWFDAGDVGHDGAGLPFGEAAAGAERVAIDEVLRTLSSGWCIAGEDGPRPVRASDIAVLARENGEAQGLYEGLLRAGVPTVLASGVSVWQSLEAHWLLAWFDAVLERRRDPAARHLMLLPWGGWTADALAASRTSTGAAASTASSPSTAAAAASSAAVDAWTVTLTRLSAASRRIEVAGLGEALQPFLVDPSPIDGRSVMERLAAVPGGERHIANLRHLVELLDAERQRRRLSGRGLRRVLERRIEDASDAEEDVELRLESDADAVKVLTMHRSKGLEFPIVIVPRLFASPVEKPGSPLRYHRDGQVVLALDGEDALTDVEGEACRHEALQEAQRLAYVALTRAQHRAVVVAAPVATKQGRGRKWASSPLALLVHGRASEDPYGAAAPFHALALASPDAVLADIEQWAASSPDVVVERGLTSEVGRVAARPAAAPWAPVVATFARRSLDRWWRRASYSRLLDARGLPPPPDPAENVRDVDAGPTDGVAGSTDGFAGSTDGVAGGATSGPGEPPAPERAAGVGDAVADVPLRAFLSGTRGGTWFHAVMEHLRFTTCASRDGRTCEALALAEANRLGISGEEARGGAALL